MKTPFQVCRSVFNKTLEQRVHYVPFFDDRLFLCHESLMNWSAELPRKVYIWVKKQVSKRVSEWVSEFAIVSDNPFTG